jgi:protein tyrosine phosphatase (PTP) superfamily phosphohydrolase (DUF442 family)
MSGRPRGRRRIWLAAILAVVVACELMVGALYAWPVIAAKWRANPERLNPTSPALRPANWAQPLGAPGLDNLFQVRPDLYRGARPTAEGVRQLKAMGVKTIVNLEVLHSDRASSADAGLNYVHISFKAWHPEEEDMIAFLKVLADANLTPVFVHCQYGADRTGTMCALYRVAAQGWSKEGAIDEMTRGGFGFHADWQNLLEFLDELDVEALKRQAGIGR